MNNVTVCMIVRNEEQNIETCLKSLIPYFNKFIICDTGSTDNTIEKIKKTLNNKELDLFAEEWRNDFSYHRNEVMKKAKTSWVFVIDADERFSVGDDIDFKEFDNMLLEKPKVSGLSIKISDRDNENNEKMSFLFPRFLRTQSCYFKGIVHNKPVIFGDVLYLHGVQINHYGYYGTSAQKRKEKFKRTEKLLLKSSNVESYHYLSQLYIREKMYSEGIRYGELFIKNATEKQKKVFQHVYYSIAYACYIQGEYNRAFRIVSDGLVISRNNIDFWFIIFNIGSYENNKSLTEESALNYVRLYKDIESGKHYHNVVFSHKKEVFVKMLEWLCRKSVYELGLLFNEFNNSVIGYRLERRYRSEMIEYINKNNLIDIIRQTKGE